MSALPLPEDRRTDWRGGLELEIFDGVEASAPQQWLGLTAADWNGREWQNNEGMLGGAFTLKEVRHAHSVSVDAMRWYWNRELHWSIVIRYSPRPKSIQLVGWFTGQVNGRVMKRGRVFHQERLRCIVPPTLVITNFPLLQLETGSSGKGIRCGNGYRASACSRSAETWAGGQSFCR